MDPIIAEWTQHLPEDATAEHVHEGFWYIRVSGTARSWIPIELDVRQRSVKVTSFVIVPPEEQQSEVYEFLLRHNFSASGVSFAVAPDGLVCLVGRIPLEDLSVERLDHVVGRVVEATETTFRSILRIGFASRLRGRG